jgi:hypothetical protein
MVGTGFTVTVMLFVLVQPPVEEGLADTVVPVVADNPAEGDHIYVFAPPAVRATDCPLQSMGVSGLMVIVGWLFTVTITVPVFVHPLASVPVMV